MPHLMGPGLHVADMDRSIEYYTGFLGMKVIGVFGDKEGLYEVLISYEDDVDTAAAIALLTQADHPQPYEMGDSLRKIMVFVDDVADMCGRVSDWGGHVIKEPTDLPHLNKIMAFVSDPDGYTVELVQCL